MLLFVNKATAHIRELLGDLNFLLFVRLRASSQYASEGPAASHINTGFLNFPLSSSKFWDVSKF
jgi:hypothetical protein